MARIIVAEDVAEMRAALAFVLEGAGHEVILTESGAAALKLHRDAAAELLILDVWMPGRSGLDVLKSIRDGGDSVPVVMISGGGPGKTLENATHLADLYGAAAMLFKPFEDDELLEVIGQALDHR
tara:strand:+ start:856 stop:1230 length:375 start_codon:yes stop_codon:yes gene_type:complete